MVMETRRRSLANAAVNGSGSHESTELPPPVGGTGVLVSELPAKYRYKLGEVYDDPVQTWLWKPHTLTVLAILAVVLSYLGLYGGVDAEPMDNIRFGLFMGCTVLLTQAVLQFDDGPFLRPHPAIWRLVLGLSVLYEMFLVFLLFQQPAEGRRVLHELDPAMGNPLPEQSYAEDCRLYAADHPSGNAFMPFLEKMDRFILAHFFGWFVKALMFRDWFILMVCSLAFELCEYSLSFQLPNFAECWWDHWILDFLVCNFGGSLLGMITCRYLEMRSYRWRSIRNISSVSGMAKRTVAQFTPYSWTRFRWLPSRDFPHLMGVVFCIFMMMTSDLNAFYIKTALWIPADHSFNIARIFLGAMAGAVTVAEIYAYINDANCIKFGQQSAVITLILVTEILVAIKYNRDQLAPLSEMYIGWKIFWGAILLGTAIFATVSGVRYWMRGQQQRQADGRQKRLVQ